MTSRVTPVFPSPGKTHYGRYEQVVHELEPATITYSRGLPSFGNPNQLLNPPQHYFPSIPASKRKGRAHSPDTDSSPTVGSSQNQNERHEPPPRNAAPESVDQQEREKDELDMDMDQDQDQDLKDGDADGESGSKEDGPAKKRSRTLTTAHQTAVLNALLAKTRFPSTETREEVGQQIGMSARRVQIWFQNRRQSQKRARDRDATEPIPGQSHIQHPLSPSHHPAYLSSDPYPSSRYASRPIVSRHASMESVSSVGSYSSAHPSQSRVSFPDRYRPPPSSYQPYPPPPQQHHWHPNRDHPAPGPARGYAFPPPPPLPPKGGTDYSRRSSQASTERYDAPEPEVRLPPLSSVLSATIPAGSTAGAPVPRHASQPRTTSYRPVSPTSLIFSHRPPPLHPQRSFTSERTDAQSPTVSHSSLPRFEGSELSRLWISNPAPTLSREANERDTPSPPDGSPTDVLDAAMETMYRSSRSVNPRRSSLPHLRPELRMPPILQRTLPPSEADAALLAPILKVNNGSSSSFGKSTRLPPISSLSLTSSGSSGSSNATLQQVVPPVFPPLSSSDSHTSTSSSASDVHRGSTVSHESAASHLSHRTNGTNGTTPTQQRSSISSFDTLNTTWTHGPSMSSSRTSFSSEVQEEWERAASALGGGANFGAGRKGPAPVAEGSWEQGGAGKTPDEMQGLANLA